MIERIQRATASSPDRRARDLVKGVLACALQNIAFMLPTSLLYCLVQRSDGGQDGWEDRALCLRLCRSALH